jgi:hypothetical protein
LSSLLNCFIKEKIDSTVCFDCFETFTRAELSCQWFLRLNRNNKKQKFNDLWDGNEKFSFICPKCKHQNNNLVLKIAFETLDIFKYLIVYIDPFNETMNINNSDIEFDPENIIINGQKFSFCSAIAHYGGASGGHYTCVVLSKSNGGENINKI